MDTTLLSCTNSSNCSFSASVRLARTCATRFSLRIEKKPRTSRYGEEEVAGRGERQHQGGGLTRESHAAYRRLRSAIEALRRPFVFS
jgi:hypothetical protein